MYHSRITGTVIALTLAASAPAGTFTSLSGIPGGEQGSSALSLSADGRTVLVSTGAGYGLWNVDSGWSPVPVISTEGDGAQPWYISGDASTLVGSFSIGFTLVGFRWREDSGMDSFGRLEPEAREYAWTQGVSHDGSVVVGFAWDRDYGQKAFRWSEGTGIMDLGSLRPGGHSSAAAISADGSVIVGSSSSDEVTWTEPFMWTESTGMVGLGLLPAAWASDASGISGDGRVIFGVADVGYPYPQPTQRGFLWTAETGMVEVTRPDGWAESIITGSSFDASVLIGEATRRNEFNDRETRQVLWTNGIPRYLDDVLIDVGAYGFEGWAYWHVDGISADGRTLFGNGLNPTGQFEAWITTIPTPGSAVVAVISAVAVCWRSRRAAGAN